MIRQLAADARALARESLALAARFAPALLALLLAAAVAAFFLWPNDKALLHSLTDNDTARARALARQISFWGDFPTGTLLATALLLAIGAARNRPSLRAAALAMLLASAAAGIAANAVRLTSGRPRPSADLPDRFHGLQASHKYHGFPSGHTATAFGAGTAAAVACPPIAVPALAAAGAVGWSRLYLKQHHPTDILIGATLGLLAGTVTGLAARRLGRS